MELKLVKTDTGHYIDYIIEKEKNFSYLGENIMLSKENLISLIDEWGGLVFIIKGEKNVSAGYVIILPYEEQHCKILEINTVFIEPEFRNKGYAERAVKEAIKIAEKENGLEYKLVSQVATTNGSSQRLMDKLNLNKVILFKEFYSQSKIDAFIYHKLIKGGFKF